MSFLDEFSPSELDPDDWEALKLASYFPTDAQIPSLTKRLNLDLRSGDWFKDRVDELYWKFTQGQHRAGFLRYSRSLGFDDDFLNTFVRPLDRGEAGFALAMSKRRALVGALYWAHQAEARRNGQPVSLGPEAYGRFASDLYLPVQILDSSLVQGWRHVGPNGSDVETEVVGHRRWTDDERGFMDEIWEGLPGADDSPTLFGVENYLPIRIEAVGRSALRIRLLETNYRAFKGSNDAFQTAGGKFASRAWDLGLGVVERRDPSDLFRSHLANPLSVTCIAYLNDHPGSQLRLMGIQNRNFKRVHSGKYCFQATAGGFTTVAGDTLRDDRPFVGAAPDPFLTITREFGEEAFRRPGLPEGPRSSAIGSGDVTLLALVRDLASCWEVGLVGEIDLPFTRVDIREGRLRYGSDYFFEGEQRGEEDPIEWVEATPAGLARWLSERGATVGEFMPFGLAAIVLSFYHRGFSQDEIHEALRPVAGENQRHLLMPTDRGRGLSSPPRPDLTRRELACWQA